VTVASSGGTDTVFFTGVDLTNGQAGVFKVPAAGGTTTVLAEGAPFADPSGVAVTASGDVFVTDTIASGDRLAVIVKIPSGGNTASAFVSALQVGYPTGIAMATGDHQVVLSGLDTASGGDALTGYDTTSMASAPFIASAGTPLAKLNNAAGLHRAAQANVFAFVDNPGNGTDVVYVIR
jgi:hypothetical protein